MADERLIDPQDTMVRYSNPVVITKRDDKGATKAKSPAMMLAAEKGKETEEILNSILPPIEWEEDGQLWRLQVSSDPATRLEVIKLNEQLDTRLQQRQARETGICPVRRELFTQCFDELIRQAAINCGERGLLLLRVRDEFRQTIAGYQSLYESSIAFGMRKALQAEQGKFDMEEEIERLRGAYACQVYLIPKEHTHYQVDLTLQDHTHYQVDLTGMVEKVRLSGLRDT
ncbi:33 kDa inner dynein arm light chain, axonemal-like isoform X2 [Diaphorina citri]|nr:33 kDa inner dynein arm light chain, axonemal-like isoform X2 [Diaphorina citri]XP_026676457.1 33 kDa inner dynein arm light chain, axonemal-like isoform X2 [Diaphorina citri]XP_026676458.1 33 kDa inner dynein arm light chain, axonemal-like isoform X2 [Diaphorina citri]XP_026676459.1 33 kDa inner dynein arm light chain, axonemal-like isoform X2 [Diaphorina citri]XP_026676460.1 33 kDa inner dynein arm light chain, axonemal-like isoform X2 [Diaphorina citri]XP_026676461.1 33 kDa inner dynein 